MTDTLPPPLSDSPTVETLERLLVGLHTPMQRGVPSPPPVDREPAPVVAEPIPWAAAAAAPTVVRDALPAVVAVHRADPALLSWSAGNRSRGTRTGAAIGVAAVTAAAVVAGLLAAGETVLP